MMIRFFTLTLLSSLFFWHNMRAQNTMPNEYPKKQIIFGNGGGFTGMETIFILLKDGRIYQENIDSTYTEVGKLSRKETRGYFKRLKKLKLKGQDFNSPGNLYHFLEERKKGNKYRMVWGGSESPPDKYKDFQIELIQLVRDMNTQPPSPNPENDNTK